MEFGHCPTALRDWEASRGAWAKLGIEIPAGNGPINDERGHVPVRLNADNRAGMPIEVVWSEALCPVRSRILNIPTGGTGFRYEESPDWVPDWRERGSRDTEIFTQT